MALMNFNPVSVVPFRKDHLEACIHSTLSTRSDDPIDFGAHKVALPDMDDSDVYLRLVGSCDVTKRPFLIMAVSHFQVHY